MVHSIFIDVENSIGRYNNYPHIRSLWAIDEIKQMEPNDDISVFFVMLSPIVCAAPVFFIPSHFHMSA